MKLNKKIAALFAGVAIITTTAFTVITGEHLAKPKQVDGLYVYVLSEPAEEYYKLGQVGSGLNTALNNMMKTVTKNVKTQYPDADGVIFDETKNIGFAIKFKTK